MTVQETTPTLAQGLTAVATSVATGPSHTCAALADATVRCWGLNYSGRLGTGPREGSPTPVAIPEQSSGVTAITAGRSFACAIKDSGALVCWGRNDVGQLGTGSTDPNAAAPQAVTALGSSVTTVDSGAGNTCAIASGALTCWGSRAYGAVGNGTSTIVPTPVAVVGY